MKRSLALLGPRGILAASMLAVALFLGSFGVTFLVGTQAQNAGPIAAESFGGGFEPPPGNAVDPPGEDAGGAAAPSDGGNPNQPILAIVIDDWGYGWQAAADFLAFDRPLTIAVLPYLPLSRSQAMQAYARGHQVILHLPMEPLGEGWDLGEGAVTTAMTSEEIAADVLAALAAVPHVSGVNNHMGSKATVDERVVTEVLSAVGSQGLFFLDSRTNSQSVVPAVAKRLGVPYLENDRFIDPDTDAERVKERILLAARLAKRRGYAVAIGHVRPETYRGLIESLPELDQEGVRLAYLWEVLERVYPDMAVREAVDVPSPEAGGVPVNGSPAEVGDAAEGDPVPELEIDPLLNVVPDPALAPEPESWPDGSPADDSLY